MKRSADIEVTSRLKGGRKGRLDRVNRHVWSRDAATFTQPDTWTDAGERNAFTFIADLVRGDRILDVGVGAGRSTWLLRLISQDYVAVDYTPEMVALCRQLHPGVDVREADARDLSEFADESLGLVVFSCNGIDAVDHDDRELILREFHRTLRPGAILQFSAFDKDGYLYREPPWRPGRNRDFVHLARFLAVLPRNLGRYRRAYSNWWQIRRFAEDHGSWAIGPQAAHNFGLLAHFITVQEQVRVLDELGFDTVTVFADTGPEISIDGPHEKCSCFHVVACKR